VLVLLPFTSQTESTSKPLCAMCAGRFATRVEICPWICLSVRFNLILWSIYGYAWNGHSFKRTEPISVNFYDLEEIRAVLKSRCADKRVSVTADSGIRQQTVAERRPHEADAVVIGSLVFANDHLEETVQRIRQLRCQPGKPRRIPVCRGAISPPGIQVHARFGHWPAAVHFAWSIGV
jgi:hypothetical protein